MGHPSMHRRKNKNTKKYYPTGWHGWHGWHGGKEGCVVDASCMKILLLRAMSACQPVCHVGQSLCLPMVPGKKKTQGHAFISPLFSKRKKKRSLLLSCTPARPLTMDGPLFFVSSHHTYPHPIFCTPILLFVIQPSHVAMCILSSAPFSSPWHALLFILLL